LSGLTWQPLGENQRLARALACSLACCCAGSGIQWVGGAGCCASAVSARVVSRAVGCDGIRPAAASLGRAAGTADLAIAAMRRGYPRRYACQERKSKSPA